MADGGGIVTLVRPLGSDGDGSAAQEASESQSRTSVRCAASPSEQASVIMAGSRVSKRRGDASRSQDAIARRRPNLTQADRQACRLPVRAEQSRELT